jgi:hypothetical protein
MAAESTTADFCHERLGTPAEGVCGDPLVETFNNFWRGLLAFARWFVQPSLGAIFPGKR